MKIDKRKTKEISEEELRDFFTASILFGSSWDNLSKYFVEGEMEAKKIFDEVFDELHKLIEELL